MSIPHELIRAINSGRCFVLIGSGPSTDMGYPSWHVLAESLSKQLAEANGGDLESYQASIAKQEYPEFFNQAEFDSGGRHKLIDFLKGQLLQPERPIGKLYETLASWPFACYLTTNWDDEIKRHLDLKGVRYATIQNSVHDLHALRDGASHLIVKLHSDLDHPSDAVITSKDYQAFTVGSDRKYFRDKLRTVFDMFDVLIVGHSMADPDIRLVLWAAQQSANPNRPIYMVAAGATKIQIREFYQNYNITLLSYSIADGTHHQLRRLLAMADRFITKRDRHLNLPAPINSSELDAAVSMLIFRRLQYVKDDPTWKTGEYLSPLILQALDANQSTNTIAGLLQLPVFRSMSHSSDAAELTTALQEACTELVKHHLIHAGDSLVLTTEGTKVAQQVKNDRESGRTQAYADFALTLRQLIPTINEADVIRATTLCEECIVDSFKRRGLAIANSVFGDQVAATEDLSELFAAISNAAASFESTEIQIAFVEACHEFLVSSTNQQKNYLAALAQGFFLFHMLGYDPTCAKVRNDIFSTTVWFCDSSILIPLLAIGSQNHSFAVDFFHRLRAKGARPVVTRRMCNEVWEHLDWAVRFIRDNPSVNAAFIAVALGKPGYKPNLFLDGFIRTSAEGRVGTISDYLTLVSGDSVSYSGLVQRLSTFVLITDMSTMDGFCQADREETQLLADLIKDDRASHQIYRSDDQVNAEAEVLFMIRQLRSGGYRFGPRVDHAYFVSQSNVLNRVDSMRSITTWTPEAVYQYLLSLPGQVIDPSLFQECLLHEFYSAGISIIDKKRYLRFFGPSINESKLAFEDQRRAYGNDIEARAALPALELLFDATPDLEKPLFVHRLTLRSVEAAQQVAAEAISRAEAAERRIKVLESQRIKRIRGVEKLRANQLAAEERNGVDPKHIRKRRRQQKRRNRIK